MAYEIDEEDIKGFTLFGKTSKVMDAIYSVQSHSRGKKGCQEIRNSIAYAEAWMNEVRKEIIENQKKSGKS